MVKGESMMIDENEFFRQAALKICGHLEIEEGLRDCIEYLAHHMPADALYLEKYEKGLGAMRIFARASSEKGERMDVLITLPQQAMAAMAQAEQALQGGTLPPVFVINRPDEEPVTRHILEALGEPLSSAMSLPLIIEGQVAGALALLAEGNDRFTKYHARLYATLKEPFFVAMTNTLKHAEVVRLKDLLSDDNRYLHREMRHLAGDQIVGADFGLRAVMQQAQQVATTESPVLLMGETGVGKDVIANAIHYSSSRSDGPFISVNCGAIPETLIDSELFGHEKGAFTGALAQKRGRFERANTGTIFLDEIGELPLQAQVRLLRVLQSKEIERVGGVKTIPLDLRVIAATNRNLEAMIQQHQFREDLWFRLNVFPIRIPPLRERKSDIPALLQHFITLKCKELKLPVIPTLSPGAIDVLMEYHWPGNIREFGNIVERALILHPTGPLSFDHLNLSDNTKASTPHNSEHTAATDNLDEAMSNHIRRVLAKTGGKIHGKCGAAELLGMHANTLRNRMNKLGISYGRKGKGN
jgi:transcriptional regulator with GAF, ATPase, and Fis domain